MKKLFITIIVIVLILVAGFLYTTRKVSGPTVDVSMEQSNLPATDSTIFPTIYRIDKTQSKVTFRLNELLRGVPTLVVGTTTEVAGDIGFMNVGGVPQYSFGKLSLNAKTFKTDNPRRDSAIVRFILKSENPENELITFVPRDVVVDQKATSTVNITGDLSISGVTKPATFVATINKVGNNLVGTATITVKRADFGLVIPSLDFIANVDEEVKVTVDVVAVPVAAK